MLTICILDRIVLRESLNNTRPLGLASDSYPWKYFKERFLIFAFISKKEYEILLKNGIVKIFLRFVVIFLFDSNLYNSKDWKSRFWSTVQYMKVCFAHFLSGWGLLRQF